MLECSLQIRSVNKIINGSTRNVHPAVITSDILVKLYGHGKSQFEPTRISECIDMERELQEWSDNLPHQLSLNIQEVLTVAPPHVFNLHIQKECTMIAIQYPL